MRLWVGLWLGLFIITPAWAAVTTTTATRVFAAVSPGIVVVKAFDASGHVLAQGSGVVIARGVVVSNCHVFESAGTASASVFYHHRRLPATLRYGDPEHDLCSFTVKGLTAPPVRMGVTAELKIGENAYAIGAPEGFDLTLSGGLISGLRHVSGGVVIQMTTPISPGSSGGGLFDSRGRLIGITSYYAKQGQQLNFALPVAWIKALPRRGKTPKELVSRTPATRADFHKGVRAMLSGNYAVAFSIFKPLAEHGDAMSQGILGAMYATGQGVPQDNAEAAYWTHKAATQGLAAAQYNLGVDYDNGQGVPQDYAKAAVQGIASAQYNLGTMYREGHRVPQDDAKALYWYRKAGRYRGVAVAQYNLGVMYGLGQGVPQDYIQAAKWFILAKAGGSKYANKPLSSLESGMIPAQIAQAQRLANQWWKAHHKQ